MDLPPIKMELSGFRRHAARFALPGWRKNGGRYTIAEGFSELFAMQLLGDEGGLVLDPFAGSGTTLLAAAARRGWMGIGIEMMPLGRFVVESYKALGDLAGQAADVLGNMPMALRDVDSDLDAVLIGMDQASQAESDQGKLACAFAVMCMMDVRRKQARLPQHRRADPFSCMLEVCEGLAFAAPRAYEGMKGCAMVEADCRIALRRRPNERFDRIITSPPFYGRWDGGAGYDLENDIIELAGEMGCYPTAPARPAMRWRDGGIGSDIADRLELSETPRSLRVHCQMLGWVLDTSYGLLREGGELHIVLENPVLEGERRALDEAVISCAGEAGLHGFGIARMPSYKEIYSRVDISSVSLVSLRL